MTKNFKLFKDGKTKSVDTKEEAEECITNGWTLVEDAQSSSRFFKNRNS